MKKLIIPILIAFALFGGQSVRAMEEEALGNVQVMTSPAFLDYLRTVRRLTGADTMPVDHKQLYVAGYRTWLAQQNAHQAAPVHVPAVDNPADHADDGFLVQCETCQIQVDELIPFLDMQICRNCNAQFGGGQLDQPYHEEPFDGDDDDMRAAIALSLQHNPVPAPRVEKAAENCAICLNPVAQEKVQCRNRHALCRECYDNYQRADGAIVEENIETDEQKQNLIDEMRRVGRGAEYERLLEQSRNTPNDVNIPDAPYFLREGVLYVRGRNLVLNKGCPVCRAPF